MILINFRQVAPKWYQWRPDPTVHTMQDRSRSRRRHRPDRLGGENPSPDPDSPAGRLARQDSERPRSRLRPGPRWCGQSPAPPANEPRTGARPRTDAFPATWPRGRPGQGALRGPWSHRRRQTSTTGPRQPALGASRRRSTGRPVEGATTAAPLPGAGRHPRTARKPLTTRDPGGAPHGSPGLPVSCPANPSRPGSTEGSTPTAEPRHTDSRTGRADKRFPTQGIE